MFTKTILTESPKHFQIGGFRIIAQSNNIPIKESVIIPDSFMAFEKSFSSSADFCFTIDYTAQIPRGKEIFRADNFMRNAIFEIDENTWEWTWFKQNGDIGLDFCISKDFSNILLTKNDSFPGNLMKELGFIFAYALLSRNACALHGIIMEYKNRGILILARSGMGKSTHSRMWRDEENALIINGDRCLCRKIDET